MAATKSQGSAFTALMITFTTFGAGLSHAGTAWGRLLAILGVLGIFATLAAFRPQKAVTEESASPARAVSSIAS